VTVPETSVHHNDFPPACEYKVRFSGKIAPVKPEAVSQSMNQSTDCQFRLHSLASDAAHIF
jgi:hypothetical protein